MMRHVVSSEPTRSIQPSTQKQAPPAPKPPAGSGAGDNRLAVTSGSERVVIRADQPLIIGRAKTSGLVIDDPLVSRRHAEVSWLDSGWVMRDLDSRNGIFLDDDRCALVIVGDGEQVRLGDAEHGPT